MDIAKEIASIFISPVVIGLFCWIINSRISDVNTRIDDLRSHLERNYDELQSQKRRDYDELRDDVKNLKVELKSEL